MDNNVNNRVEHLLLLMKQLYRYKATTALFYGALMN